MAEEMGQGVGRGPLLLGSLQIGPYGRAPLNCAQKSCRCLLPIGNFRTNSLRAGMCVPPYADR
jgi:hypothetical protein